MIKLKFRPVSITDLPTEWIDIRRAIVVREGRALRAGLANSIEVQDINSGTWHPLQLPNNALSFTTAAERDHVLDQLQGVRP